LTNHECTNVYNRVDVRLNSHDVGGVTDRDLRLARLLDELALG
jgi:4a-hydroxytetrahydrobiopterin dehydratase